MTSILANECPTARKAHRCGSCGGRINPGEMYRRWKGTGDDWVGIATLKECAECCTRYGRPLRESTEAGS